MWKVNPSLSNNIKVPVFLKRFLILTAVKCMHMKRNSIVIIFLQLYSARPSYVWHQYYEFKTFKLLQMKHMHKKW